MENNFLRLHPMIIDMFKLGEIKPINVVEGDVGTSGLSVTFLNVDMTDVSVSFNGDNSTTGLNPYIEDFVNVGGKYEMIYPSGLLKAGRVDCQIILKKNGLLMSTVLFQLSVKGRLVSDSLIVDKLPIFEKILIDEGIRQDAEVERVILFNSMESLRLQIEGIPEAELSREQAELLRIQLKSELDLLKTDLTNLNSTLSNLGVDLGEKSRDIDQKIIVIDDLLLSVETLKTNIENGELNRVSNETERVSKEIARQNSETIRVSKDLGRDNAISAIDAKVDAHKSLNKPHEVKNLNSNKTYMFGIQVSAQGSPQIIYEEVL